MARDLDLTLLRAFLTVVEAGSISAAANKLNRTQAAVSQQIKRLEDDLDTLLISRGARGVGLTDAGSVFMRHAHQLIQAAEAARLSVSTSQIQTRVRVGVLEDLVTQEFAERIAGLRNGDAPIRLDLVSGCGPALEKKLLSGEIEILITETGNLKVEPVASWQQALCWVAAKKTDIGALSEVPLVLFDVNEPCTWRDQALSQLDELQIPWKIMLSSSGLMPLLSSVQAGLGMAIMLESFARNSKLHVLEPNSGLPALPEVTIGVFCSPLFIDHSVAAQISHLLMSDS